MILSSSILIFDLSVTKDSRSLLASLSMERTIFFETLLDTLVSPCARHDVATPHPVCKPFELILRDLNVIFHIDFVSSNTEC